jgi:hypothetical protein
MQFDTVKNKIQGYHWSLSGADPGDAKNSGMEALTYYSDEHYFVSFQSEKGVIYVYKLNADNSGGGLTSKVKFTLPKPDGKEGKLSDLHWHSIRERLYALYDSNAKSGVNRLQELSISVSNGVYAATQTDLWITPEYADSTADWEGCTFVGDDLYLGLDRSGSDANVIYKFANFAKPGS